MRKTKNKKAFSSLLEALKLQKLLKSGNINEVIEGVNSVVEIIKKHEEQVLIKVRSSDFSDVNGIDFNSWAYTQAIVLGSFYFELKNHYHDLHFELHCFNAYD